MEKLENYSIRIDIPEVEEYLALRKICGLSARGKEASKTGLSNSIYSVIIRRNKDQKLAGMGRLSAMAVQLIKSLISLFFLLNREKD